MVDTPDEQSVVTYVAQFLEHFPELEAVRWFFLPAIRKWGVSLRARAALFRIVPRRDNQSSSNRALGAPGAALPHFNFRGVHGGCLEGIRPRATQRRATAGWGFSGRPPWAVRVSRSKASRKLARHTPGTPPRRNVLRWSRCSPVLTCAHLCSRVSCLMVFMSDGTSEPPSRFLPDCEQSQRTAAVYNVPL